MPDTKDEHHGITQDESLEMGIPGVSWVVVRMVAGWFGYHGALSVSRCS